MREEDFEEEDRDLLEEEFMEEYCDDPYDDSEPENEEEYIRMLAERGEGLLMGEDEYIVIDDEMIDEFNMDSEDNLF